MLSNQLRNLPAFARLPGIGAAEGAIFGAGASQPGSRVEGAKFGALFGGAGAPIAAGIGVTATRALRPVARRLGDSLFGTPRDRAVKEIMSALDADDINRHEALALMRQLGPGATLADLGDTLARQGRAVTSQMGQPASRAKRFLDTRQRESQMQLRQAARRATGADNFDKGVIEIINSVETKAKPIYDEVFSEVIDVTPNMLEMLERDAMKVARRKAASLLRNEGFSTDIIDDVTDVRYMDAVKRALDDNIGVAQRQGRNNEVRVLTQLKNNFVSEIDSQVPRYAEARSVFAGERAIKDAADFGQSMFAGNKRVADVAETVRAMSEGELQAARAGFLDWLSDELSKQSTTRNTIANKFANVPKFQEMVSLLFPDREAVDEFISTAAAQARFGQTRGIVTGGSPTARIQSDRASLSPGAFNVMARSAVDPAGGLAEAMRLFRGNTSLSPEVLDEMGKILFNPNLRSRDIKRGLPVFFDIPRGNPVTTIGAFGGAVGSQSQNPTLQNLRSFPLLP